VLAENTGGQRLEVGSGTRKESPSKSPDELLADRQMSRSQIARWADRRSPDSRGLCPEPHRAPWTYRRRSWLGAIREYGFERANTVEGYGSAGSRIAAW